MAIMTVAEVKSLLRLTNSFAENEKVIFVSREWHKLAQKPNVAIVSVSSSNGYSTSAEYTTSDYETQNHFTGYTLIRASTTSAIITTSTSTSTGGSTCYINYTYNDYDNDIVTLLPLVQMDVLNYLNNDFEDEQTEYASASITFVAGSSNYIKDTGHLPTTSTGYAFSTAGFEVGMDVLIRGSYKNWGLYNISSITANSSRIKFASTEFISERPRLNYIEISRVRWPKDLKLAIAQIIWFNLEKARSKDVQSRSLGPSSVTYVALKDGAYPESIYGMLAKYRNCTFR
jgi:hypothetical protein